MANAKGRVTAVKVQSDTPLSPAVHRALEQIFRGVRLPSASRAYTVAFPVIIVDPE
jgi:hypothetical protein